MIDSIENSVQFIQSKSGVKPRIGITLGSGLASFAKHIDVDCSLSYSEIPSFAPTTVDGHPGQLLLGHINQVPVAVLQGRIHYYEGHTLQQVVHPTRVLAFLGIETLILTNAAGGLNPAMKPGDLMVISDHINLSGDNPLRGRNSTELGPRFPDMSEAYDKSLVENLVALLQAKGIPYFKGVYCGVSGPSYETPAEVQFLRNIGGSAVGMSTVPETIAAVHLGLRVCGISCITNLGSGLTKSPITHEEVKEVGKKVETVFSEVIKDFVLSL